MSYRLHTQSLAQIELAPLIEGHTGYEVVDLEGSEEPDRPLTTIWNRDLAPVLQPLLSATEKMKFRGMSIEDWRARYVFADPKKVQRNQSVAVNANKESVAAYVDILINAFQSARRPDVRHVFSGGPGVGKSSFFKYMLNVHFKQFSDGRIVVSRVERSKVPSLSPGLPNPGSGYQTEPSDRVVDLNVYVMKCLCRDIVRTLFWSPLWTEDGTRILSDPEKRATFYQHFDRFPELLSSRLQECATLHVPNRTQLQRFGVPIDSRDEWALKTFADSQFSTWLRACHAQDEAEVDSHVARLAVPTLEHIIRTVSHRLKFLVVFDGFDQINLHDFFMSDDHMSLILALMEHLRMFEAKIYSPVSRETYACGLLMCFRNNTINFLNTEFYRFLHDRRFSEFFIAPPAEEALCSAIAAHVGTKLGTQEGTWAKRIFVAFKGVAHMQPGSLGGGVSVGLLESLNDNVRVFNSALRSFFLLIGSRTEKPGTYDTASLCDFVAESAERETRTYRLLETILLEGSRKFSNFLSFQKLGTSALPASLQGLRNGRHLSVGEEEYLVHEDDHHSGYVDNVFVYHPVAAPSTTYRMGANSAGPAACGSETWLSGAAPTFLKLLILDCVFYCLENEIIQNKELIGKYGAKRQVYLQTDSPDELRDKILSLSTTEEDILQALNDLYGIKVQGFRFALWMLTRSYLLEIGASRERDIRRFRITRHGWYMMNSIIFNLSYIEHTFLKSMLPLPFARILRGALVAADLPLGKYPEHAGEKSNDRANKFWPATSIVVGAAFVQYLQHHENAHVAALNCLRQDASVIRQSLERRMEGARRLEALRRRFASSFDQSIDRMLTADQRSPDEERTISQAASAGLENFRQSCLEAAAAAFRHR